MKIEMKKSVMFALALVALTVTTTCFAQSLPWESPLCGLATAMRGGWTVAVGTIAFVVAAASWAFGQELTGIAKSLVTAVFAVSVALGGASFVGWIAAKVGGASACTAAVMDGSAVQAIVSVIEHIGRYVA